MAPTTAVRPKLPAREVRPEALPPVPADAAPGGGGGGAGGGGGGAELVVVVVVSRRVETA
jgi:hypothetical protein